MTDKELIELGKKYLERERATLIDNCYRARIINSFTDVPYTTEELKKKYRAYFEGIKCT